MPSRPAIIELTELLVDDVVFVDDAVRFQAKLSARGFAGEKAMVRLKELEPGSKDPAKAQRARIEGGRAAAGRASPSGSSWSHHPKTTGERTFIIEVDKLPRELQTDNNRIERVVTVRKEKLRVLFVDSEPRYEFRYLKNYLERDETIDLNVVLLSSDPNYSEQDRSAIPTFPAAKDDLFAYDVVIFGDADISYMSQSQLQNMVEFVTEKGGGVLFVAGDLFNPLAYHGTPLELLLPIELSDARNPTAVGTTVDVISARADARRARQPDLPVRRRRRLEHADLAGLARAVLVLRGAAEEAGGTGAGGASDGDDGSDGKLPLILVPVRGCRQVDVSRVRRYVAMAVSRGRPVFRAVLGADDPVSGAVAAGWPATGRGTDRPPPLPARPADPVSGAVSERGAGAQSR